MDQLLQVLFSGLSQGGTMIIPGHGWISDAADVGYYRDMLIVIRDRVKAMVDKGMTLAQVKAAKPTLDFDPEYGREAGVTARFVEAVCAETGAAQVDLVCHSLGGVVALEYIHDAGAKRVRRCVTVASPHAGVAWKGPILGTVASDVPIFW